MQNFQSNSYSNQSPHHVISQKHKINDILTQNQVFYCQCGKNYLSFPALYLHAKNKHKIKLTSKMTDKVCKKQKRDDKIVITYFLNPINILKESHVQANKQDKNFNYNTKIKDNPAKEVQSQKGNEKGFDSKTQSSQQKQKYISQLKQVIKHFILDMNFQHLRSFANIAQILQKLVQYVKNVVINSKQFRNYINIQNGSLIRGLPLFFNDFIIGNQKIEQESYWFPQTNQKLTNEILYKLGEWLQHNQYTHLITKANYKGTPLIS